MRPADKAWLTLAAGVAAYEVLAVDDELLSEAADRYMLAHPWITRAVAYTLAAHLCNQLPDTLDPLHWLFTLKRRWG